MNVDVLLFVSFAVLGGFGGFKLVQSYTNNRSITTSCDDCPGCEACTAIEFEVEDCIKKTTPIFKRETATTSIIINNNIYNDLASIEKLLSSVMDRINQSHSVSKHLELKKQQTQLEALKLAFNQPQQKLLGV